MTHLAMTNKTFEYMKGFSWGFPGQRGEFIHPEAATSLAALRDAGCNWVCICFGGRMNDLQSTEISFGDGEETMVTDAEIRHAVATAHRLGLKVILKPMVETRTGQWRGHIELKSEADLKAWWKSFGQFVLHYARIAEETGCAMLNIGCEMLSMEAEEARWRDLIRAVREVYRGEVTYNSTHGSIWNVNWWDAVDQISVSAYYPVGHGAGSTVDDMRASWTAIRERFASFAAQWGKPVFFIEIGMMSSHGNCSDPACWWNDSEFDGEEQAHYYEAALAEFWNEPWFTGFFWWRWDPVMSLPEIVSKNSAKARPIGERGFRIQGKPAENILRSWYANERSPAIFSALPTEETGCLAAAETGSAN